MATGNSNQMADRLSAVPLFYGLPPKTVRKLAKAARHREVTARQCFFIQGDDARDFFVLMSGRVKIAQHTSDGARVVLDLISPNEPFGGLSAARGRRYGATAEAIQGSVAIAWSTACIRQIVEDDPRLALNALDFVSARLDFLHVSFRQLATECVERRVAAVVLQICDRAGCPVDAGIGIDFPISRQDIAEMSGTTLFTVSRLLGGWRRQGIVGVGRQRVVVLKRRALAAIAVPDDL